MSTKKTPPKRLITFIDGFNLYFGIRDNNWRNLLWLDLSALASRMAPDEYQVVAVKYFTARILNLKEPGDPNDPADPRHLEYQEAEESRERQSDFIDAVKSTGVVIYEGLFRRRNAMCRNCGAQWCKPEEKMTDVQIATQLLASAFRNKFDAAMVISGDADVVPPIRIVVQELGLPVIVAFPPGRKLLALRDAATDVRHIGKRHLAGCQLPDVVRYNGVELRRPAKWS